MSELFDESEVRKTLSVMLEPGGVFEVRLVGAQLKGSYGGPATVAGYFDNPAACVRELEKIVSAEGIYVTMNPIDPALLARCANRLKKSASGGLTKDPHVLRRLHFLIDLDPKRPSGISATDEEKEKALEKSRQVYAFLRDRGWPEPIVADSGNGYHSLYFIDLPCDDTGLLEKLLGALAERFNGDGVELDRTVHNPSRITKLYGTLAAKGDNIPDRPHRLSKILVVPGRNGVVTREQLQSLADQLKPAAPRRAAHNSWDMEAFLAKHGAAYSRRDTLPTGETRWRLKQCPFDPDHVSPDAAVFQYPDGVLGFNCFHTSCFGKQWHDFRRHFEPDYDPDLWASASKVTVTNEPREPLELPPPPPPYVSPPLALLPAVLQDYIHAAAESLTVDVAYILLPKLSSIASAIGNSRSIVLKPDYIEPPVIWTGIIGNISSRKSPSIQSGCFAISLHERELVRQNEQAKEQFADELAQWEAAKKALRGAKPELPVIATCKMDDLTLEALADRLEQNPRGVLVAKDELSHWLASFDQYRTSKGSDVSRWLSIHTGVEFGIDRRSENRHYRIWLPRVSITGGIQPRVLRRVLTEDYFERGLPARFLFAYPPFHRARWSEVTIPDGLTKAVRDLFDELWLLQPNRDERGQPAPILLRPDDEAKASFVRYYNECGDWAAESDEREEAAWGKLSGYAARLALVGQLGRNPASKIITADTMQAACELSQWFGVEAARIYATLAETTEQRERRELIEFIERRGGDVYDRDVMQSFTRLKNNKAGTERELTALVKDGLGNWEPVPTTERGGRPARKFHLLRSSTSTQPPTLRGKTRGSVDVDSCSSQKNEASGEPEPAPEKESPAGSVSVPLMMTKQMESDLLKMGYSQAEIDKMAPGEAWEKLGARRACPEAVGGIMEL